MPGRRGSGPPKQSKSLRYKGLLAANIAVAVVNLAKLTLKVFNGRQNFFRRVNDGKNIKFFGVDIHIFLDSGNYRIPIFAVENKRLMMAIIEFGQNPGGAEFGNGAGAAFENNEEVAVL